MRRSKVTKWKMLKDQGTILATLCYVQKNNKTLMLLRNKKKNDVHKGKYNGLGGKFETGESPEECVIREVKEESGLIIKPQLRGLLTFPLFSHNSDWYVYLFTAQEFSGTQIDSGEGELEWVENSKLLELNLWEGDKFFLRWLLEGKFFSAKFIYKEGSYHSHSVSFYNM